ncbi:hypothetical protein ECC02_003122 [Trypanosoma cruzi]|uniref:Uncharacterized protein n=1 Tax=Trypanosoma cruzi TaxID=5693 RepID=A0A7J6YC58_TRYCR|nr:hypothetical protein ECC02_003122 [Trypanosoma cruzi]
MTLRSSSLASRSAASLCCNSSCIRVKSARSGSTTAKNSSPLRTVPLGPSPSDTYGTTSSGRTNTPCPAGHEKYDFPITLPSLRPMVPNNSMPIHKPGAKSVDPTKRRTPRRLSVCGGTGNTDTKSISSHPLACAILLQSLCRRLTTVCKEPQQEEKPPKAGEELWEQITQSQQQQQRQQQQREAKTWVTQEKKKTKKQKKKWRFIEFVPQNSCANLLFQHPNSGCFSLFSLSFSTPGQTTP